MRRRKTGSRARRPLRLEPLLAKQLRKAQRFALLLRLLMGNSFVDSLIVEDPRGPLYCLLQEISCEEFGERKPGIAEVHEGLKGDRVLHPCQHCIMLLKDNISPQGRDCLGHQELASAASQAETANKTRITGGLER